MIYGQDDRVDVYDTDNEAYRLLAQQSIVALVSASTIDASDPTDVQLLGAPLRESQMVCDSERFSEQPTAAFCSGTLIAPDLVLTAGHCVANGDASCRSTRFVFNYYQDSATSLAQVSLDDVFACSRIVAYSESDSGGLTLDYAVVQLDRPATPRFVPADVAPGTGAIGGGTDLLMVGFPSGLPCKIEDGGAVLDSRPGTLDYFIATTDSFGGNSGSGVFDRNSMELVGILVSGEEDYEPAGSCYVVHQCDETCEGENITYAFRAIQDACDVATDAALCASSSSCGDGYCAWDEDSDTCDRDCSAPVCGDGACDGGEYGSCPEDCIVQIPGTWACAPSYYAAGDGCDCDCGAPDPDCEDPNQEVLNCGLFATCTETGVCEGGGGSSLCHVLPAGDPGLPRGPGAWLPTGLALGLLLRRRLPSTRRADRATG